MDEAEDPRTARCMEVLSVIGDLWTLAIVMALQESGAKREGNAAATRTAESGQAEAREPGMRFNELQRAVPKLNAVTLTNRLRKLEDAGVVSRVAESRGKQSTVYDLTPFGRKLLPIVDAVRTVALDLERSGFAP
ncbi:winged helix-turn-helix transcriptional regulator [Streptomyces sp. CA-111067]|uniref:winged helix-turn-helix transcriptional regulator n=1 Tax=Streptomyces sp. CA-111067 TaxID=3240046 RepID=UPI003D98D11C